MLTSFLLALAIALLIVVPMWSVYAQCNQASESWSKTRCNAKPKAY
jgi:hypothetical protein